MAYSRTQPELDVVLVVRRKDGTEVSAAHIPRAHVMVETEDSWWAHPSTLTRFTLTTRSEWTMYTPEFFQRPKEIEGRGRATTQERHDD